MERSCLVCGNVINEPLYENTLIRCRTCGFITANTDIDAASLKAIYSSNYFNGEEYADYLSDKKIIVENFKRRLDIIKKVVPVHLAAHALEIGCAYGFFGEEFLRQFPDADYMGFDVAEDAVGYAKQKLHLRVSCEDFLISKPDFLFTDVFLWDVIEHLPRPDLYLEKISNTMNEKGRIYITTGDIGAFIPGIMKNKWRLIHPPSHLHYFNKNSISMLLKKNGFSIKHLSYPGTTRSIRQIYYSLFLLDKKENSFLKYIYNHIPERLQITINTRDIMFVIAEKNQ